MLTILIATRNGAKTLPLMLESLCNQTEPKIEWKLVVVDNGSTDNTLQILTDHLERLPLVILREPIPGKNRALNRAIHEVVGDIVLFSDDDVIFDNNWIASYRMATDKNPDFDVFGGPIYPRWSIRPADWILKYVPLGTVYAITEGEIPDGECSIGVVWGANFCVRQTALKCFGKLPENIGPSGNNYAMGSESAFLYKLSEKGSRSFFVNEASVEHIIREYQLERDWILNRAIRFGRGQSRLDFQKTGEVVELLGRPRWVLKKLLHAYFRKYTTVEGGKKFKAEWDICYLNGFMHEYRQCKKESNLHSGRCSYGHKS